MLKIQRLLLKHDQQEVINNISLSLKKGEKLVIVGASGCGKTTLLKAIAGFHPISKGRIEFNNTSILDPTEQLVAGHEFIKLVNQDFNLDDFHTVEENIKLKLLKFDKAYLSNRVEELLKLTELTKFKNHLAKNLSGGQKQRLAIARALADEPDLLLLDEPFNQLDFHLKTKIENYILKYLSKYNITSILVSHNGEDAMRWADKIAFMKNGKIERIDSASHFYNSPRNKYEALFFGELNTILIDRKEVSFRPHQYKVKQTKKYNTPVKVVFQKTINRGWYYANQFLVGKRRINLFSSINLKSINQIWIKPLKFN